MAEAIVRGVLARGVLRADQMIAADPTPARRELFQRELSVTAVDDNRIVGRSSKIVLLSVKPQKMAEALAALAAETKPDTLVISIAAGISTRFIEQHLGESNRWRVVRTMPNTPMLVGEGMAAIAAGTHATADDLATARKLFESAAVVIEVDEDKMNAVTALSGSGPAYFFYLVEHMIRAAVELGMTDEQAKT